MANTPMPYVVLVGIDYTPVADLAFDAAYDLASHAPSSELHAVHVVTRPWARAEGAPEPSLEQVVTEARVRLAQYAAERVAARDRATMDPTPDMRVLTHVRTDDSDSELATLASDLEADVVVVGSHARGGFPRLVLGSFAEAAVRFCPCPVLVIRPKATPGAAFRLRPPCPDCLATRRATGRQELWCATHREHDGQREPRPALTGAGGLTVTL